MIHLCLLVLLPFVVSNDLLAQTIGSNTLVARQQEVYFKANETNKLLGFSVFEKGFYLEDSATSCEINVFFPLSGSIGLSGGTVTLKKDVVFQSPFFLGSGTIDANSCAIEFTRNISTLMLPYPAYRNVLSLFDQITADNKINSVDFSFDSQYVAVTIDGSSQDELRIYYLDDETLTVTASYNFSSLKVFSVRWHPSEHYLAVGKEADNELNIFHLDVPSGVFNLADSANILNVNAVAWHPDGTHVAVGEESSEYLRGYPVSNGTLGTVSSLNLGT